MTCAPGNEGCTPGEGDAGTQPSQASRVASCERWFGFDVSGLACSPSRLAEALAGADLGSRGQVRFTALGTENATSVASAPGLAQGVGRPLRRGDRVEIAGELPSDMRLMFRLAGSRRVFEVALDGVARRRMRRTLTVVETFRGPTLRLLGPGAVSVSDRAYHITEFAGPLRSPLAP